MEEYINGSDWVDEPVRPAVADTATAYERDREMLYMQHLKRYEDIINSYTNIINYLRAQLREKENELERYRTMDKQKTQRIRDLEAEVKKLKEQLQKNEEELQQTTAAKAEMKSTRTANRQGISTHRKDDAKLKKFAMETNQRLDKFDERRNNFQ